LFIFVQEEEYTADSYTSWLESRYLDISILFIFVQEEEYTADSYTSWLESRYLDIYIVYICTGGRVHS